VEVSVRVEGTTLVVTVRGRLVAGESVQLGGALEQAVADAPSGVNGLLINVRDVPYIDSQGLGSVIRGQQAIAGRGGRIAIAEPQPNIARVFTVTKLSNVVPLYDDEQSALLELAAPTQ
jgi:stage II sporulation protein AA (anti-sigma F factor antagonist)